MRWTITVVVACALCLLTSQLRAEADMLCPPLDRRALH